MRRGLPDLAPPETPGSQVTVLLLPQAGSLRPPRSTPMAGSGASPARTLTARAAPARRPAALGAISAPPSALRPRTVPHAAASGEDVTAHALSARWQRLG